MAAPFCTRVVSGVRGAALCLLLVSLWGCGRGVDEVQIPGGITRIGDDRGRPDERPSFVAEIAPFRLDRGPVTVAAFARFVATTGFVSEAERLGSGAVMRFGSGAWRLVEGAHWRRPLGPAADAAKADHPVTQVSWNDAVAYCAHQGRRLPTELEFEHAARLGQRPPVAAGVVGNVWTGVFPLLNTAEDGYAYTSPVGAFGRDRLGLVDMAGNVWEWMQDAYGPYDASPAQRVQFTERVQRGGSFLCNAAVCQGYRPSARAHASPDSALLHVGFRCARDWGE